MIIYPLKSNLVRPGDSILRLFTEALVNSRLRLRTNDVLAVSSKIIALSENRVRSLDSVRATEKARGLAKRFSLNPSFTQLVLSEADSVIGGVRGALLTIKGGDAVPNAGIDRKNAPRGSVVLWPRNPDKNALRLRQQVKLRFGKNIGVVIVDSRVAPLRLGTIGFAIGSAGFHPTRDQRGASDLSGRRLEITFRAVADGLAAAAQLVMGEADERVPFALIRETGIRLNSSAGIGETKLSWDECLYMSQISPSRHV
ncbi:MAG TPA: coenzyme F420-0:L-glutamate ligase [Candidatus Dormibacteraeota bacterium]|nr:coenzyme F420-0:L-glutamate ligase [Candidatus Dormibacteraeota bacterium]